MTICGTGHRPPALGGYSKDILRALIDLATVWLASNKPGKVISGMALGWDTALAIAAIRRGIPTHAYVPCPGQSRRWPEEHKMRYLKILAKCSSVLTAHPKGYTPECMQRRNELMVDDADLVLALWNGVEKGGTWNCVRYARKVGRPVVNLWDDWSFEV